MSTIINLRNSTTVPSAFPQAQYRDALTVKGSGLQQPNTTGNGNGLRADGERLFAFGGAPNEIPVASWWSERASAEFTLAGSVQFNIYGLIVSPYQARLRVRLSKMTVGGSNIETPICQADAAADLTTTSTKYTFSATPSPSVVIAPDERLLIVVTAFGTFGTGHATLQYDGSSGIRDSNIVLTETVTLQPNAVRLFLRNTTATGIGNFLDMITGSFANATVTPVVNTAAGATEVQYTRTAGGIALEWISPRVKRGMLIDNVLFFAGTGSQTVIGNFIESNASANVGARVKVFARKPDGTETLIYTVQTAGELLTTGTNLTLSGGTLNNTVTLAEDDRFVLRAYIYNVGTMGGGFTATLDYNNSTAVVQILEPPGFKAESDPGAVAPGGGPTAIMTGGVG